MNRINYYSGSGTLPDDEKYAILLSCNKKYDVSHYVPSIKSQLWFTFPDRNREMELRRPFPVTKF